MVSASQREPRAEVDRGILEEGLGGLYLITP